MIKSDNDMQDPYKKPPIIEAVIAMHFSAPLELKVLDTFTLEQKARFSRAEDLIDISTTFNAQTRQSVSDVKKTGNKLISHDGTRIIKAMPAQFAVIQLAPYTNWDTLCGEARKNWNALSKIIKHRVLTYVSTRFVNRIDIPIDANGRVDLHRYFAIGLSLPSYVQAMTLQQFHVNCALLHPDGKYRCVLQLSSTPSPLIDHISFTIDIDVATTEPIPQNQDEMWNVVGSLRQYKNDLFESCITDETRKLFQ